MDQLVSPWILEHTSDVTNLEWFIVRTVGFIVLAAIVVRFIVPVIRSMLSVRRQTIVETTEQVRNTLVETEQLRDDYRGRLERIAEETELRLGEAVREAEELQASIRDEAREQADALVERTRRELRREREKTMAHLRIEFTDDVIEAARHAASRSLTRERQADLVGMFVREIGAEP
ncbi:MAG: ATP synthase F0 subunit B [Armatimonadetes bacterium]|nr:ATP synthase F0 subunit B [Armatimonadota bacterium]